MIRRHRIIDVVSIHVTVVRVPIDCGPGDIQAAVPDVVTVRGQPDRPN